MNKKFKVEYEVDPFMTHWIKVTHNGYQWHSIRIDDPSNEIPLIIKELRRHLSVEPAADQLNVSEKL